MSFTLSSSIWFVCSYFGCFCISEAMQVKRPNAAANGGSLGGIFLNGEFPIHVMGLGIVSIRQWLCIGIPISLEL